MQIDQRYIVINILQGKGITDHYVMTICFESQANFANAVRSDQPKSITEPTNSENLRQLFFLRCSYACWICVGINAFLSATE